MADITTPTGGAAVVNDPTIKAGTPTLAGYNPVNDPVNAAKAASTVGYTAPASFAPQTPQVSTTTISNGNKIGQAGTIMGTTQALAGNMGIKSDGTTAQYANGTAYDPMLNPFNAYKSYFDNGGTLNQTDWENAGRPSQDNAVGDNQNGLVTVPYSKEDQGLLDQLNSLKAQTDSNTQSAIDTIQNLYGNLITQQNQTNAIQQRGTRNALIMSGQAKANSTEEENVVASQVAYGTQQIANLNAKEQSAIQQAQAAGEQGDLQLMQQMNTIISAYRQQKMDIASKINDSLIAANQKKADANAQAAKDDAISGIYTSGTTDVPGILAKLKAAGYTDITSDDIVKSLANIVPAGLDDLVKTLQSNGAPGDVIQKVMGSQNINDAYKAAGSWVSGGTGKIGEYNFYKASTEASGLKPMGYQDWIDDQNKKDLQQKSAEAYATAYASASGKAKADQQFSGSDLNIVQSTDPDSGSILSQTGLSVPAFNFLTQGTSALTRMTAAQRSQYMTEAQNWLNKNGVDLSTFQSQYEAYNNVLKKNVERANNTQVYGGEISGTVDQFLEDIGKDFGNLKVGNVTKLLAGQQVNDPLVQKYAFDLQTMQNDLAGYYAASRGDTSPNEHDQADAANVIKNGISAKSAQAFKDSINSNEGKVTGVVNNAVNAARQQVWNLFGVGKNFKAPVDEAKAKTQVDMYYQGANSAQQKAIDAAFNTPGITNTDVLDYMKQNSNVFGLIK